VYERVQLAAKATVNEMNPSAQTHPRHTKEKSAATKQLIHSFAFKTHRRTLRNKREGCDGGNKDT